MDKTDDSQPQPIPLLQNYTKEMDIINKIFKKKKLKRKSRVKKTQKKDSANGQYTFRKLQFEVEF